MGVFSYKYVLIGAKLKDNLKSRKQKGASFQQIAVLSTNRVRMSTCD